MCSLAALGGGGDGVESHAGAFVRNDGQWDERALFRARFGADTTFVERTGWVHRFDGPEVAAAVRVRLVDTGPVRVEAVSPVPGVHHYLVGPKASWRTDVPRFAGVRWHAVAPGVDVRAYEREGHFEFDVEVAPGGELDSLELELDGVEDLALESDGSLTWTTAAGPVRMTAPVSWEVTDSGRRPVASQFVRRGSDRLGFAADWSGDRPLVIDPGVIFGTYLGGSGEETVLGVAETDLGFVAVGETTSPDYPTGVGALASSPYGQQDVFATFVDATSGVVIASTYLGGNSADHGQDVAVGRGGLVSLAGYTASTDFPTTTGAMQRALAGGTDAFLVQWDPAASGVQQLRYATLFGGSGSDVVTALEVEDAGSVVIAGHTASPDLPTTVGAFRDALSGGMDAFAARLAPERGAGEQLRFATYFGGYSFDLANDVSTDLAGRIAICGDTVPNSGFPITADAWDPVAVGAEPFAAVLDPSRSGPAQLDYSTFVGGSGLDLVAGVNLADTGMLTVVGTTYSSDYPTVNAVQSTRAGWGDVFVSVLDLGRSGPAQGRFSTYLGGGQDDFAHGLAVDRSGLITVVGSSRSDDYPTTTGAAVTTYAGGIQDAVITRLDPFRGSGDPLFYSSFLGVATGQGLTAYCVATTRSGGAVLGGGTASRSLPTTPGAIQAQHGGGVWDGFVTTFDMLPTGVRSVGASTPGCAGAIAIGVDSMPGIANSQFSVYAVGSIASVPGALLISSGVGSVPIPAVGVALWIDLAGPVFAVPVTTSIVGTAEVRLSTEGVAAGAVLGCQYLFVEGSSSPSCPSRGVAASPALEVTVQG